MGGELPGRARKTHLSNIRDGIELDEKEDLRQNTFLGLIIFDKIM